MPETPLALSCEEWDEWHEQARRKHPVWYFFYHRVPRRWGRFMQRLSDAKWWVLHRIHPRHRYHIVHSRLSPGYYDPDTLILHTAFAQFERFYKHWDWTGDPAAYAQAHVRYIDDEETRKQVYDDRYGFAATVEELHAYWMSRSDPADATETLQEEDKLHAFDDAMLHKLITIRRGLWN